MNFIAEPTVSAPSIASSSMLVSLSISVWTGRKKDREATDEVLTDNGATRAAGAFSKNLMADCAELDAVKKFASAVRTSHLQSTMPWSDTDMRLVTTARYFAHAKQMTGFQQEFDKLVEKFLAVYDWRVADAAAKLGSLFNRDEYPTVEGLRSKFAFKLAYLPVPEAGDWRVDIDAQAKEALKEQYKAFYAEQMERAMRNVWERLHTEASRLVSQLDTDAEGKKGRIYESTIETVQTLAEMLEEANYTGDPNLQLAQRRIQSALAGVTREDLVANPKFRADTKTRMEEAIKALPSLDW
jgi:hypothetical protein